MAAAYNSYILNTVFGPEGEIIRDRFKISQTNFQQWLHVWIMDISVTNPNNRDIIMFRDENKEKYIDLIQNEIRNLGSIKVSFGLKVNFQTERNGELQEMSHYFKEDQPHVFTTINREQIEEKYEEFMDRIRGEIENWSAQGSGWDIESIELAYINVAKYVPLRGGSYLPLPAKLANKKAIVNVKNKDNECLKWALRAALYPPEDGVHPERPSKYNPQNDKINYAGIDFPTPLKQIDKLEKQNSNLAINVFGWEKDSVIVHRISEKEKSVKRINLMLIESGEKQHYCWVKRVSALLFDKAINNKTFYCMLCLSRFTKAHVLVEHEKYCNGVNGRPTRIEMPEEGKNNLSFNNYHKQMKAPYIIYADFEAVVRKYKGCERGPDYVNKNKSKCYTEKTEHHEACGYSFVIVRSDGQVTGPFVYRGENAVKSFLRRMVTVKDKIRENLSKVTPLAMEKEDWNNFKNAENCHICEKKLVKENFLDSLPVYTTGYITKKEKYQGQYHKRCFYEQLNQQSELMELLCESATKENDCEMIKLKKVGKNDKQIAEKLTNCYACKKPLLHKYYRDAVKDHCHLTGKYRGAAHSECKLKLKINPKTHQVPVVFHNLRGYDAHHLMQAMANLNSEVKCVANNMEKYITFSVDGLRFIDSLNFMLRSLDSLVEVTPKEALKITKSISNCSDLLYKKGIYPYEYVDSLEKFTETSLPSKEEFYSSLNDQHISEEEYTHAKEVWKTFDCKTLGDYHDLYVKTDVALLADVFENFRELCLKRYGLDPAHYFTSPGLSWDALLKMTGVNLELLTDHDMHLFVERGIRGGISMVSKRYAKANNPLLMDYDKSKPNNYIMYLDANNLYGWAMSKPLPKSGFKWKRVMPTEEEILNKKENAKKGWILEVDLEYPSELHKEHNSYPLAPEKKVVKTEKMSDYQNKLIKDLKLKLPNSKKLLLTLEDKNDYVVHYENLKFYLNQGMKLKRVKRALEFDQECWMEPYIRMNTEFRKEAKNNFEKDFYKLMNNSVFGKTMENLRNRVDIKIVRSNEHDKIRKLIASPLYSRHVIFTKNLVGIDMHKSRLLLNKPVYTGMTILDKSKILMYDFFYNHLKKQYGEKCELLYTDTDSLLLDIKTEDVYKDIERNMSFYDTSDYPEDHPLFSKVNKKVLGKMKDECEGIPILEYVGLRSKMYSVMTEGKSEQRIEKLKKEFPETEIKECSCKGKKVQAIMAKDADLVKEIMKKDAEFVKKTDHPKARVLQCCNMIKIDETNVRKAKGVKKNVIKKQIKHEQYKKALFKNEQMWHGMKMLRSDGHEIYGIHVNKISLSPFDSKRWIADNGVNTRAYGYNNQIEEMESLFSNIEMDDIELTNTEMKEIEEALKSLGW